MATLRTVALFDGLDREALARLVGEVEEVQVTAGQEVVARGQPGDAMYIVAAGTLEARNGRRGPTDPPEDLPGADPEEPLAVFGALDWFGEMALLTDDPRSASVVALTDGHLLRITRERFHRLASRHPAFLHQLTRGLCKRLVQTSRQVVQARAVYERLFDTVLAGCQAPDRRALFALAVAPRLSPEAVRAIADHVGPPERLQDLALRYPALVELTGDGAALHEGFGEHLRRRLAELEPPEVADELHATLVELLEQRALLADAFAHAAEAARWPEATRLLRTWLRSPTRPDDVDLLAALERIPDGELVRTDLVRTKAEALVRLGRADAAIAAYERAFGLPSLGPAERQGLLRTVTGAATSPLDAKGPAPPVDVRGLPSPVAFQQAQAASHLAAGRPAAAYLWARSAEALARGLGGAFRSPLAPLRRSHGLVGALTVILLGLGTYVGVRDQAPETVARFLAVLAGGAGLWALGHPPDWAVALAMGLAWALLGVVSPQAAVSGFAGSTWLLMLGVLGIAAALARSGLLYRITLLAARQCPPTFAGQTVALLLGGIASTLLIPSAQARMTFVGPAVLGLSDTLHYPARSAASAGLAQAALLGFCLSTALVMTGTPTCLLAWRLLPDATRADITWLRWLAAALPLEIITIGGSLAFVLWRHRPARPSAARAGTLRAQMEVLGPATRQERLTAAVAAALLLGWLTEPWHGIDAAWLALGGLLLLVTLGILDRQALQSQVDWTFLLFMGMVFTLADLVPRIGADLWLAGLASGALSPLSHPAALLAGLVLLTMAVRLVFPWQTAVPLLVVGLTPVTATAGLSPFLLALVALKAGNIFLVPSQNPYYLTLYYGTEERAFTHEALRPLRYVYAGLVLVAFVVCLPYWRAMGLVRW